MVNHPRKPGDLWRYLIRPESNGDSEELQPCRININSFCQQSDSLACCFATITRFIVRETPPRFLYVCIWNPSFYPIVSQRIGTLSKPSEGLFDREGFKPSLEFDGGGHVTLYRQEAMPALSPIQTGFTVLVAFAAEFSTGCSSPRRRSTPLRVRRRLLWSSQLETIRLILVCQSSF